MFQEIHKEWFSNKERKEIPQPALLNCDEKDEMDTKTDNDLTLSPCNVEVPSHERRGRCQSQGGSRLPASQGLVFLMIFKMKILIITVIMIREMILI